jgi:hypothetical protein
MIRGTIRRRQTENPAKVHIVLAAAALLCLRNMDFEEGRLKQNRISRNETSPFMEIMHNTRPNTKARS